MRTNRFWGGLGSDDRNNYVYIPFDIGCRRQLGGLSIWLIVIANRDGERASRELAKDVSSLLIGMRGVLSRIDRDLGPDSGELLPVVVS